MALRAFHANPCIGGFGGESTPALRLVDHPRGDKSEPCQPSTEDFLNGDVFCQIVKELVDNAVDACTREDDDENKSTSKNKRVKVEIKPDDSAKDSSALQVIVSDNGCGMENIQNGVDAFQSSKTNSRTAGRYGIGLTLSLALMHASRLPQKRLATSPELGTW
jgi:signal transduction histidine kinase